MKIYKIMKINLIPICIASAAVIITSCAVAPDTGKNYLNKQYFDAWMQINHPDAASTTLGSRIIYDQPGTGELVGDLETNPYVYCDYEVTDLAGTVSATSYIKKAQQVGFYSEYSYIGPAVFVRGEDVLAAGLDEMFETMRVGGTRTAVIPGWLMTTDRYKKAEDYLENGSGDNTIYTITVREAIPDIVKWETDSLDRFIKHHFPGVDSTELGYYYIQTVPPIDDSEFEEGAKVYVDYTGRLLSGQVFDSTIADTTKKYRFYSESKTYEPVELKFPENENERLKFSESESETIQGFEKCILNMKAGEKGFVVFYSGLGYGSRSQSGIPSFSPLMFEIHMLGLNQDGSIPESND